MILLIFLIIVAIPLVTAVVTSTVARPWLVDRGYLCPKVEKGSRSYAALGIATIFKPEMEYVIEEDQSKAIVREDDQSGEQFNLKLD